MDGSTGKQISRSPAALRDVEGHIDYLKSHSVEVADRFLHLIEETFQFLLSNREAGQRCQFRDPQMVGVRVWPVHNFRNYLVFYRSTEDGIVIERVLHGARDIEALFGGHI